MRGSPKCRYVGLLTRQAALVLLLGMISCSRSPKAEPVRAELSRLQKETGLTLAKFELDTVFTVNFANRSDVSEKELPVDAGPASISPSGKQIAINTSRDPLAQPPLLGQRGPQKHRPYVDYRAIATFSRDGSDRRDYVGISSAGGTCWSPDETKLAIADYSTLAILDLQSGTTNKVDERARVMSQCWSPDGKQFVYWVGDDIRMYDADQDRTRSIAKGTQPTWSPDGKSIAFLDSDAYFSVCPGADPKPLFETKGALSGLWWSPDSRIVAYLTDEPLFGRAPWLRDVDAARLRVRRLGDGSDDWVDDIVYHYNLNYQWITSATSATSQ
jgi:hypothetical protein